MKKKKSLSDPVRVAIGAELEAQKPEWVREITESITHALGDKIDKMYVKLDTFIGEIKARREEQTLHSDQHKTVNDRLDVVEKHVGISP